MTNEIAILRALAPLTESPLQPLRALVYPDDGTVSPFTVINLGSGQVKIGDSIHDDRLPALWFGRGGLGMGVEQELNRRAVEGETLAVVTFGNVDALDVLLEVVQRIRQISFRDAPGIQPAGYIDRKDLSKLGNCRVTLHAQADKVDPLPLFRAPPDAMLQEFLSIIHDRSLDVGDRLQRIGSRISFYCKVPVMQEDPVDIIRTLLCAVDEVVASGSPNEPSPIANDSPLMLAARRACVERGFTAGGLAINAEDAT
jgi:hypothetical protein